MTDARAGSADNGSNAAGNDDDLPSRAPSLDGGERLRERRLKILVLLSERTLWKAKVGGWFTESVQTIGRDVNALHADGLLRSTVVTAEDEAHDQYIAFATTAAGEDVLEHYVICERCGEVVDVRRDCAHDYVPITEIDQDTHGGEQ